MLNGRIIQLLDKINSLVKCKNVKFSTPPLTVDTTIHTPSKYAIGGFRHHGEWINTFIDINKTLRKENIDFNIFMNTNTGRSFVKSLTDRVYSLKPNDIYEILLILSLNKIKIDHLESTLLKELEDSLEELHIFQLLELPNIINNMDIEFSEKFKKVVSNKLEQNSSEEVLGKDVEVEYGNSYNNNVYNRILNKMIDEYKRKLSLDYS